MQTQNFNLDTFKQETGRRFRMTREQTARFFLTRLSDEDRNRIASMTPAEAVGLFGSQASNRDGNPVGWVSIAIELAGRWSDNLALANREAALAEHYDSAQ